MKKLIAFLLMLPLYAHSQSCEENLEKEVDKFSGKKTFYTPLSERVMLTKIIDKGITTYYLSFDAYGSTLNVSEKGVSVLFENGEKMKWPNAEIDANSSSGSGWRYSCFIKLSILQLDKFIKNRITDFQLYIYNGELTEREGEDFMCNAKAIKSAK